MKRTKEDEPGYLRPTLKPFKVESAEDFEAACVVLKSVQKEIRKLEHKRDEQIRQILTEPTSANQLGLIDENGITRWINASTWMMTTNQSLLNLEWPGDAPDMIGELWDLLFPVAALQEFGCVEEITAKIDNVKKAIEIVKNFPKREQTVSDLEETSADLEEQGTQLAMAEKILSEAGWKFNLETRRASRIGKHKGKDLLVECVWEIYTKKYRKDYRKASTARKMSIRRKIASALASYFDATELSPESGAPIYMAIYKGEKRPR
jgi:predicted Zn-ribbon and HTH transcriptional regulator